MYGMFSFSLIPFGRVADDNTKNGSFYDHLGPRNPATHAELMISVQ